MEIKILSKSVSLIVMEFNFIHLTLSKDVNIGVISTTDYFAQLISVTYLVNMHACMASCKTLNL